MVTGISDDDINHLMVSDLSAHLSHLTPSNGHILRAIMEASGNIVRATNELSSSEQYSVTASLPAVRAASHAASVAVQIVLGSLLAFTTGESVQPREAKNWSFVEDSLDGVFACLDEAIAASTDRVPVKSMTFEPFVDHEVLRPQFAWKVDNFRAKFISPIREKLNAIEPLGDLEKNVYEYEIRACLKTQTMPDASIDVIDFEDLHTTDFVLVNTDEGLNMLIEAIIVAGEVAIDLEHHDVHSYRGFTCLIQLSTRTCDYIIDPFPIFASLYKLNIFTTDPKIFKILHGADMDIQWLQRDFGVYIVNMFDTGQAARVIGLAGGFGLANLLATFCKVTTNKKFQMADWRIRPLPKDMINYARIDTHYLLYIKDRLVNALLSLGSTVPMVSVYGKKMLGQVLEKSFGISSKIYKDASSDYNDESVQLCLKRPGSLRSNPAGMAALAAILAWRDMKGKTLDESRHFVLSNSAALRIANGNVSTAAQILRLLSHEANAYMAPMRIDTELAEALAQAIRLASVQTPVPIAALSTEPLAETRNVSLGSKFGSISREKISKEKVSVDFFEKVGDSELSRILTPGEKTDTTLIDSELMVWLNKPLTPLENDIPEERMEDDVPVHVEFVPLTKRVINYEQGELPPTILETRKKENEKAPKRAKKNLQKPIVSSAEKALQFIERELS